MLRVLCASAVRLSSSSLFDLRKTACSFSATQAAVSAAAAAARASARWSSICVLSLELVFAVSSPTPDVRPSSRNTLGTTDRTTRETSFRGNEVIGNRHRRRNDDGLVGPGEPREEQPRDRDCARARNARAGAPEGANADAMAGGVLLCRD